MQQNQSAKLSPPQAKDATDAKQLPDAPAPAEAQASDTQQKSRQKSQTHLKQSSRILGVVPNFSSVSADTTLPPLTPRGKFNLATSDSFDYSSFVLTGILAAKDLGLNSDPELGSGAAGYGRYYWREFADQMSGTYFTEFILPVLTHEDPRYYTLGGTGFFRRTGYALSRVVITRTDSEKESFNYSEVLGDLFEAGLSNAYYPPQERGLHQTTTNWATQLLVTGGANVLKEFWPNIRHNILREK